MTLKCILILAILAVLLQGALGEDELGGEDIGMDVSSTMGGEDIFKVGTSGMTPGIPLGSQVTSVPMGVGEAGKSLLDDLKPPAAVSDNNQSQITQNDTKMQEVQEIETAPADLSGKWTLSLIEDLVKTAALSMMQSGEVLFGSGSISYNNSTQMVTASGTLEGNSLKVDLVTYEGDGIYRLNLTADSGILGGSYDAFAADGTAWSGAANGTVALIG